MPSDCIGGAAAPAAVLMHSAAMCSGLWKGEEKGVSADGCIMQDSDASIQLHFNLRAKTTSVGSKLTDGKYSWPRAFAVAVCMPDVALCLAAVALCRTL